VALICVLFYTSCTQGFVFRVFNNTGDDLVIVCYDFKMTPKEYPVKNGLHTKIPFTTKLIIKHSSDQWEYGTVPTNEQYKYFHYGLRSQALQIEPGGNIYVLLPKIEHIVAELPSQPTGFPVSPKKLKVQ
jgi:hypothetical protein